jgi:RecA-family ATPase
MEQNQNQNPDLASQIEIVTLEDVYRDEIEDAPIIDGVYYEGEALVIHADGGVGKSLISQDIAMHLGAGASNIWGLFNIPKARSSLFVQSENSRKALQTRAKKKIVGDSKLESGIGKIFFCGYKGSVQMAGAMSDKKFRKYLLDYAKAVEDRVGEKIGNMVFDPLISFSDGDENDNAKMRRTLDLITETAGTIGATPTVLHHSTKGSGELRGASAIQNWARTIIKLERVGAKSDQRIMVTNTKNNNHDFFKPFALELDENLNFRHRIKSEILSPKKAERCMAVADALREIGGRVETQDALIEKYREHSELKSNSAAQDHINLAEKTGFILSEEYRDGKLNKKRYLLPKENG